MGDERLYGAEVDPDPAKPLIQPGSTLEVHARREGRYARNIGFLLMGVAFALIAVIGLPAANSYVRSQHRMDEETVCRSRIIAMGSALGSEILSDQADIVLAAVQRTDVDGPTKILANNRARQKVLATIQANAVEICHHDPGYDLPPEARLP